MDMIFPFLVLLCVVGFIVSFFSPEKSLFWVKNQERTTKLSAAVYIFAFILCIIAGNFVQSMIDAKAKSKATVSAKDTTNKQTPKEIKDSLRKQVIEDSLYKISQEKLQKLLAEDTQTKSSQNQMEYLPDVTAAGVYLPFTNLGFSKNIQSHGDMVEYYLEQTTASSNLNMMILGKNSDKIERIRATAQSYSDDNETTNFLAMLASLPYKNARPQQARNWVLANISNQNSTTTIGGVSFTLLNNGTNKMLTIEPAP